MVEFRIEDGKLVCAFQGRMDTVAAMKLENTVDIRVREAKKPVVFDLAGVEYVSSSFIPICLQVVKAVGKENFSIVNAADFTRKVFTVAGLEEFL